MLTETEIRSVISQTYADIALAGMADMRVVADVFEAVRKQLYNIDAPDVWDYLLTCDTKAAAHCNDLFDDEEDKNDSPISKNPFANIEDSALPLARLREAFSGALIKKQMSQINETLQAKLPGTLATWYQFYAEAAVHFREDFICMLCLQRSKWDADTDAVKHDAKLVQLIRENRWADAFPYYEAIASSNDVDNKTRMLANVALAEITIHFYPDHSSAGLYISRANELAADAPPVKRAQAQLALKNKDYQTSKNILQQVMSDKPSDYLALIYAGDCFAAEEVVDQAELWYIDALQKNFLQTETYKRLINLYANKKWFSERKNRIYELVKRIEKRYSFRNSDSLIAEGLATADCFKNIELYHAYRDAAAGFYANDDMDKAEELYQTAIGLQPALAAALLDLAYLYIRIEKWADAKDCFGKAKYIDKDNFDVYWGLAYYYEKTSQKEDALEAYRQCLQLRPAWNDSIHNLIGNLYFSFKEYEQSAAYFRMAIAENKNILTYQQNLADALTNAAAEYAAKSTKADEEKAAEFYTEAATLYGNAEAWNTLGNFHFAKQQWQEAIDNFSKAVAINDKEPVYYGNVGLAYENMNDKASAQDWYQKAIQADDNTGRYYNRLGLLYYYQNDFEKAIEQYQQALEREPDNADYLNNICLAYRSMDKTAEGEPYFLRFLNKEPDNDMTLNVLGVISYQKGDYERALDYYKQAIEKNNKEEVYHENLSLLYKNTGKDKEAIKALQAAAALNPNNDTLWNNIGVMYFNLGDNANAIAAYQKAISIDNKKSLYYENLGLAYERNNEQALSVKTYEQGLDLPQ